MWKPLNISSFSRMPHSGWVSTSIALSPHSLPFFVLFRLQSWLHIRIVNVSPIGVGCCWHPRLICAVTQSKGIHHLLIVWLSDGSWRWIELAKRPQSGHRSKCQLKSAVGGATAIKVVAIKCSYCYRRQMHISLNQKKKNHNNKKQESMQRGDTQIKPLTWHWQFIEKVVLAIVLGKFSSCCCLFPCSAFRYVYVCCFCKFCKHFYLPSFRCGKIKKSLNKLILISADSPL